MNDDLPTFICRLDEPTPTRRERLRDRLDSARAWFPRSPSFWNGFSAGCLTVYASIEIVRALT